MEDFSSFAYIFAKIIKFFFSISQGCIKFLAPPPFGEEYQVVRRGGPGKGISWLWGRGRNFWGRISNTMGMRKNIKLQGTLYTPVKCTVNLRQPRLLQRSSPSPSGQFSQVEFVSLLFCQFVSLLVCQFVSLLVCQFVSLIV